MKLPSLTVSNCELLTICGRIKDITDIKEEEVRVSNYKDQDVNILFRTWINTKKGGHLHVDFAVEDFFTKVKKPKVTCPNVEDALKIIEPVLAHKIEVNVLGNYKIKIEDLPEKGLIKLFFSNPISSGDIEIKIIGSSYKLSGIPIKKIDWRQSETDKNFILIRVEGELVTEINENYFIHALNWLDEQFSSLVLDKRSKKEVYDKTI